jgi:hypothetical protein
MRGREKNINESDNDMQKDLEDLRNKEEALQCVNIVVKFFEVCATHFLVFSQSC